MLDSLAPLLKFVSAPRITPSTVQFIVGKLGYNIPDDVALLAVDSLKSMMAEKKYTNLGQVVTDGEFLDLIGPLTDSFVASNNKKADEEITNDEVISIDSAIRCPHCELGFAIRDSIKQTKEP